MASINNRKDPADIDSEGNALRRNNVAAEALAGSATGVGGSTARTYSERAAYKRAVESKSTTDK